MVTIEQFAQDLRYACRSLARARGITAAAVLILAAGTAGTTAMFALVQGVLLRPLPIGDQQRVVVAWSELRSTGASHWPFPVEQVKTIAAESRLFEQVAGVGYPGAGPMVWVENGVSSYVGGVGVTGRFFDVLGVRPVLGRALAPADDLPGAEPVLVITHALWLKRYGGAADVIGRKVTILERPFSIVGVMPADVEYPQGVEAWMSVATQTAMRTNEAFTIDVDLIARLRRDATLDQAAAELQVILRQIAAAEPADAPPPAELTPVVRPYAEAVVGHARWTILVLFGAIGLVLLVATVNVANLLLLRGEERRSELTVRAALGAGRARLVRYLVTETVILVIVAGVIGFALARWALPLLLAALPLDIPRTDSIHVDTGVALFTLALGFLTTAAAGVLPALSSSRADLQSCLRGGQRRSVGTGSRNTRRRLVAVQVALAVVVLAAAGLLARSALRLQAVDLGLDAERLALVELSLPQTRYSDRTRHLQFLDDVVRRLEASPQIARATPLNNPPYGIGWDVPQITAEGQSAEEAARNPALNLESVHPGYFETLGVRMVRGRFFTAADRQGAPEVAIVSEEVAARAWPGGDPIGRRLKIGDPDSEQPWRTVVGVAEAVRYRDLAEARPTLFVPAEQFIVSAHLLMLRTAVPVDVVAPLAREAVRTADPSVHVMDVTAFADLLREPLARPRFNALLVGLFGGSALLLAAVGLYAVIAASVRQRQAEIGVRVALGATAGDVRRLVLREGFSVALIGAAVGLGAAMAVGRMLTSLLFEIHPLDPTALIAAAALVIAASAVSCYLPALRASRLDPMIAVRTE
jgi:predicted permease